MQFSWESERKEFKVDKKMSGVSLPSEMRALRLLLASSSSHQLSVWWVLLSILIVSSSPSRSSTLSPTGSSIIMPSSAAQSRQPNNHVQVSSDQQKITASVPSSTSSLSKSPVSPSSVFLSTVILAGDQFPSMFTSFNFPQRKLGHANKPVVITLKNSTRRIIKNEDSSSGETSGDSVNSGGEPSTEKDTDAKTYFPVNAAVSYTSILSSDKARRRVTDIDKSDNQISSHHREVAIAPFPRAKFPTTNRNDNMEQNLIIHDDGIKRGEKTAEKTLQGAASERSGDSAGTSTTSFTFSFSSRPKRQLRQQTAQLFLFVSSNSTGGFLRGRNETDKKPDTFHNSSEPSSGVVLAEQTVFTKATTHQDQIVGRGRPVSVSVMPVPSASPPVSANKSPAPGASGNGKKRMVRVSEGIPQHRQQRQDDRTLTILGLFELTHNSLPRERGRSERIAAEMALEDINAKGILQGYRLTMHTNDTQASSPLSNILEENFFHSGNI